MRSLHFSLYQHETINKTGFIVVDGIAGAGVTQTTTPSGPSSLSLAKITLKIDGYKGSISILGGTDNTKPSDYPVAGGTGDFLFVQGYIRSSPVDLNGPTVVYKIDFFLYWPPYATAVHVSH
uniref:Dirigent protein n=1 Tax=Ananas comosus var. bracteatus TaxID=296719 RepID=A0A6V7QC87_ANACO|nr:unnamed protein product [Ananas comosus var. bracteatus]